MYAYRPPAPRYFTQEWVAVEWLRESELKHSRVAMLAVTGYIATDCGFKIPGEIHDVSASAPPADPRAPPPVPLSRAGRAPLTRTARILRRRRSRACRRTTCSSRTARSRKSSSGSSSSRRSRTSPSSRCSRVRAASLATSVRARRTLELRARFGEWARSARAFPQRRERERVTRALSLRRAGFDPLGFSKDMTEEQFSEMQLRELKNGRLAMLAIGGVVTQDALFEKGFPYF